MVTTCDQGISKRRVTSVDQGTSPMPESYQPLFTCDRFIDQVRYLSVDTCFNFMGAPSWYTGGSTATTLSRTLREARIHEEHYKKHIVPHGYLCINKVETVTFPDSRVYRLEDCWMRSPTT